MDIFGSSGVRGVAGKGLSPEFVLRIARAAATVWDVDRVAVARDTRTTGQLFANIAAGGAASTGTAVDRLGIAPTPAVTRYCEVESLPGILITASHNPPQYNGVKLIGTDGIELPVRTLERIEEHVLTEQFTIGEWNEIEETTQIETVNDDYVEELLASVDRETIADANLTVALDPAHGAGALTSPEFYRALGCSVITVNAQPDGHFPGRMSEPVKEHLEDLCTLVEATDADVGIAHDGDADRAIFIDEDGNYIDGDTSLAALAAEALSKGDTTVAAVNVSQRLVDVCDDVGATLELTPIGATNIITRIKELWAEGQTVPISGEGNGGIFFPNYRLVRDGAYIGAKFLELLADSTASEVVAPYQSYHNVRYNIEYRSESQRSKMLAAAETYVESQDATPNTIDGYRLDYGDAWVLVRPSGTEPKIRIYAEGREADRAQSLADGIHDAIMSAQH
ncbi:phosphoglucosamine mutase [Natronocalculus amylovorans]|uniref:Phosphoglucosamine mutase n=1 Tax=Natronocalculus amylovorans TaxID=2917812 RepID=A0AAE3FVU6_9EURY|nr:phosphoglucosamine mutase [Natronocalculus amylovorans]MCL9816126.1 phosphoglucosamine mutase [Natronocalculus amylovorans]NUE01355.1 phosphoglucosamine mutase [Halorubraceae archaeon YAN]